MSEFSRSYSNFEIRECVSSLINSPENATDLTKIISNERIRFKESYIGCDSNGKEVLGACKSKGLNKLIVVSPSITSMTRTRFTIAHEIGHLFLHHGNSKCISTDFDLWRDKHIEEIEANAFAAELLIPYQAVVPEIKQQDLSYALAVSFAERYITSISTSAIRLVKLDKGMSAVVYHNGVRIAWVVRSQTCPYNLETASVDIRSLFQRTSNDKTTVKAKVDPDMWFNGLSDDWICQEETHFFSKLKTYLTILNVYEL